MLQNYNYRARNAQNQIVTGLVQATSVEVAKKALQKSGLTPVTVSLPRSLADFVPFVGRVSLKDRTMFARQLATMIDAGLTLSQAMRLMIRQSKKGKFRSVMEAILNDIQDGFSFSTALSKFPDVFDNIFINVVRSGEATGKLEIVLNQLATNMEKDVKVRGKIKGAMMYPAFIIFAMVVVAIIMLTKVIPQLSDVFANSGQQLPITTRSLLMLSAFFTHDLLFVILLAVVFVFAVRYFLRTPSGIHFSSVIGLKIPVFGSINVQSSMARFGRLLGMLLNSGVPLLEALKLVNDSFTNVLYRTAVTNVAQQVERGIPMSVPISQNPIFPVMVGQMVSVGEQTGKMDEVMTRMAEYYDSEVDVKVNGLSSLIEPMVIVILGIGVAWLVVGILLPIYQISSAGG